MKWNTNMHRCAIRRQKVISGTASEHLHSGWLSSPKQSRCRKASVYSSDVACCLTQIANQRKHSAYDEKTQD